MHSKQKPHQGCLGSLQQPSDPISRLCALTPPWGIQHSKVQSTNKPLSERADFPPMGTPGNETNEVQEKIKTRMRVGGWTGGRARAVWARARVCACPGVVIVDNPHIVHPNVSPGGEHEVRDTQNGVRPIDRCAWSVATNRGTGQHAEMASSVMQEGTGVFGMATSDNGRRST